MDDQRKIWEKEMTESTAINDNQIKSGLGKLKEMEEGENGKWTERQKGWEKYNRQDQRNMRNNQKYKKAEILSRRHKRRTYYCAIAGRTKKDWTKKQGIKERGKDLVSKLDVIIYCHISSTVLIVWHLAQTLMSWKSSTSPSVTDVSQNEFRKRKKDLGSVCCCSIF